MLRGYCAVIRKIPAIDLDWEHILTKWQISGPSLQFYWNVTCMFIREHKGRTKMKNGPKKESLKIVPFQSSSPLRIRVAAEHCRRKASVCGQMFLRTGVWGCPLDLNGYDSHSRPHRLQRTGAWLLMICGERKEEWLSSFRSAMQRLPAQKVLRKLLLAVSLFFFFCCEIFAIMRSRLLLEGHLILKAKMCYCNTCKSFILGCQDKQISGHKD